MPMKAKKIRHVGQKIQHRLIHPSRKQKAGYQWYQSKTWKRLRVEHLSENPYCVTCQKEKKPLGQCLGNVVDHIQPHKGNKALFLSRSNLQTLCHRHHSQKTCREDGGFGNKRKS